MCCARAIRCAPFLLIAATVFIGADRPSLAAERSADHDFFEKKIRPVLVEHCYKCHSAAAGKAEGGLSLDTRSAMRAGGSSGPAVVPSDEDKSLILAAIRHDGLAMPPDRKLPAEVIADFERWIAAGAADPRDGSAPVVKPTVDYAEARKHWAFQPLRVVAPPTTLDAAWSLDPIDRFVLAKLEAAGVRPAPQAERRTLLRRASFLLTGLPPTPAEVAALEASPAPNQATAYAETVDRLLASPEFGVRWGRHWLDTARYAESNGKNMNLWWPHAWRYRDYVIDALNRDLPYDRFLREQIAGDLLPADNDTARTVQITATGFLAIGSKSYEEASARERLILEMADDQIDVVMRGMLGLTVACARCHDHKFDPIPQTEYYALVGIFQSSETLCGPGPKHNGYKGSDSAYQAIGKNPELLRVPYEAHDKLARDKDAALGKLRADRYRNFNTKTALEIERKAAEAKVPLKPAVLAAIDAKLKVEINKIAEWDAKIAATQKELAHLNASYPPAPGYAMAMREAAKPADCALRLRGEWKRPDVVVPRGTPSLFQLAGATKIEPQASGRLQLAAWIADAQNPLTARVAVNRIWHHLFGQGLVETLDNFGNLGDRPSHPELLDYLAAEFMRDGWSTKRFIRRLMLTRTFQLAVDEHLPLAALDPDNRLFGRRVVQRLEAEAIRDAMHASAGTLELARPVGSQIMKATVDSANSIQQPPPGEMDRTPRSIYLTMVRSAVPEMFALFDFPDPSLPAARREQRTLPTQALYLMNSPLVVAQSLKLAERVLNDATLPDDAARIDRAYLLCFGRHARTNEQERAIAYLNAEATPTVAPKTPLPVAAAPNLSVPAATVAVVSARLEAWTSFCQTLFAAAEFRYLP
ncbi:MAG: PSD1 and planctomycete cytochrome C domain-containing protein [Planctomycetia bacterium]|nr:PSD1 and planctomycete cytochrome C domain-containing protein [Planctomycetia bacterium]